jgi:cytosine deaminase
VRFDIVVRNARLPDSDGAIDVGVLDGRIAEQADDLGPGETELNAAGGLVAGGFVDPHVHLDKALVADQVPTNESRTLAEAIENDRERKRAESASDVKQRAERAIEMHVRHGCTRIRTHVDIDPIGGLTALEGVLAAREACSEIADVQIVVFPQEGIECAPGTEDLLEAALERDVDGIGGIPALERTDESKKRHVDTCLSLGARHDVAIDLHVDETDDPTARSAEYLAARTIEEGLEGRVTAGHVCALAGYDESHAERVIDLLAEAEITVISNPGTNLMLQGQSDQHPKRRGITRVDQLREAGVTVASGQDNIQDAFYQYNNGHMLETASLIAHAAHLQAPAEQRAVWGMVTKNAASVLGVDHGMEPGTPAAFNVFQPSVRTLTDALRCRATPRAVIHDGAVIAETTGETTIG